MHPLVFWAMASNNKEVDVVTRSLMQQLSTMAAQVDAPVMDISQGHASPGWKSVQSNTNAVRLIRNYSSKNKPADAFVAIVKRNHWFWIDGCDLKSKRVFAFMMMLFALADKGEKEALRLITIPAQRRYKSTARSLTN